MGAEVVPGEAEAAVRAMCGGMASFRLVTDRRGTALLKATGPGAALALKIGAGQEAAVVIAREASVLDALGHGRLLGCGRDDTAAWMITPWYDGPSTWEALSEVRAGRGSLPQARQLVVDVCRAVADLHASDWVHGDLQPHHALHTRDRGVVLIDCSWAWKPGVLPTSGLFPGGLPHLLAPELAAAVEAGARPLVTTKSGDVYALAASLWWAITGKWPLDYAAAGVNPVGMPAGQLRYVIGSGRIPLYLPKPWPTMQDVLATALRPGPDERPSAVALAAAAANVHEE